MDRERELRDTILFNTWRLDQIDKWISDKQVTEQHIIETQAELRANQKRLMAQIEHPTGFLERIFSNALTAKDKGVLTIAGVIIIVLALIFFGPSAESIVNIIKAFQSP